VGLRQFVVDAWSWLNFKPAFSDPRNSGRPNERAFPGSTRSWIPEEDRRRLAAYTQLAAYDNNQAGELASMAGVPEALDRREFGDPSAVVDLIVANVLGEDQQIVVPGAEQEDADNPTPESAHAAAVQERLREWAQDELLSVRMLQAERKAVLLGDVVYLMAWDPAKQRPRLSVIDPGFFFPVIDDMGGDSGDYPETVHLAWEIPADPRKEGSVDQIRRITYQLGPIGPATVTDTESDRPARRYITDAEGFPLMTPGDQVDPVSGGIVRQYPWNDTPAAVTCYLTDATWNLKDIGGGDVYDLDLSKATIAVRPDGQVLDRLDLQVDFVPVIGLANSIPHDGHWGKSSLAPALQVFDELAGADTDAAHAAATTGLPIVAIWGKDISGAQQKIVEYSPGMVLTLGEGGGMGTVDTSLMLAELRNYRTDLRDRAAIVLRIPAVAMGTLDPGELPSGYALQLSLGPLDSLVGVMRLARDHKYLLMMKFGQRLFMAGHHPDWTGPVVPARIVFGSYTPTDRAAVLNEVTEGYAAHVLSLETCIRMLVDAGFPIDDVADEIQRIQQRAFEQAGQLADATGDQTAVREFLNLPGDPPTPPVPVLPPTPADTQLPPTDAGNGAEDNRSSPPTQLTGGKAAS
jgi:hypothetical protein